MRIASVNANKRLSSSVASERALRWIDSTRPDLLLLQEPFPLRSQPPMMLGDAIYVAHNKYSAIYAVPSRVRILNVELPERCLAVQTGGTVFVNTYLSPYRSAVRTREIDLLRAAIQNVSRSSVLFVGDFNLAPSAADGLIGEKQSKWTSGAERTALASLMRDCLLVDLLCPALCGTQEYSIERVLNGEEVRFRCDLALASNGILSRTVAKYDHTVRLGAEPWTDHSAIVIEVGE